MSVHAAAHVLSGNPPDPEVRYRIDYSTDAGATWRPVVEGWSVPRRGHEPGEFWSQSLCWGAADLADPTTALVRVRFRNDGGKSYARCEAHLTYSVPRRDATRVTFAWTDDVGDHEASHVFGPEEAAGGGPEFWDVPTGRRVRTRWVDFTPVGRDG